MIRARLAAVPPAALVLLALLVVLSLTVPRFASAGNLANVARIAAILLLAASGQAITIVIGGLDFSSSSAVAVASVVTVLALPSGTAEGFALGGLSVVALGAINGGLIAWCGVPAFLATLGTLIAAHGLASLLVGGIPLNASRDAGYAWIAQGSLYGVSTPVFVAALGLVAAAWLLRRTALGRSWYLIGANRRAASVTGIGIERSIFLAYIANSVFVALAGVILTARVGSGQPNLSPSLAFEAIAACAIGGLPLTGGSGTPLQVLLGVLIVTIVGNAVVLLNLWSAIQLMLIGALTIGAVLVQQVSLPRLRLAASAGGQR